MQIGELVRRTGRSAHTIRWYEAQRLIPGVRRNAQGRRVYVASHVDWLDLLERLRRTGMSIAQIREYANLVRKGDATLAARSEMLRAHREKAVALVQELQRSIDLIDRKLDFYAEWAATGVPPPQPSVEDAIAPVRVRAPSRRPRQTGR